MRDSFLYLDDVGRLKENYYFSIGGASMPGKALILGGLKIESDDSSPMTIKEVKVLVTWLDKQNAGYDYYYRFIPIMML